MEAVDTMKAIDGCLVPLLEYLGPNCQSFVSLLEYLADARSKLAASEVAHMAELARVRDASVQMVSSAQAM